MPYILLGAGAALLGLFAYIKVLRGNNAALKQQNAMLKAANDANLASLAKAVRDAEEYQRKYSEAVGIDAKQAADKAEKLKQAGQVKGSDSGTVTQADLDAIAAAKKKGK